MTLLTVRDLAVEFRSGVRAVDGLDLDLDTGRVLGVVGESGSGKSTLARMLVGLVEPTGGRFEIEGRDAAGLRETAAAVGRDPRVMAREGWAYLDLRDAVGAIEAGLTARFTGAHVVGLAADDTLLDAPTPELLARYAPEVPLTRAVGPRDGLVDTRRARELLGFRPRHSIHRPDARPIPEIP